MVGGRAVADPAQPVRLNHVAVNCQRCGARPATVHVTQLDAVGHAEAHLCTACCQAAGWVPDALPPPVAELLAGGPSAGAAGAEAEADDPVCPECGLRLGEYQQVNLFGCSHDYQAFGEATLEMVRRWHGAERHVGRRPGAEAPAQADAARIDLEARLAAAVSGERYEEAARLRDELRRMG